MNTTRLYLVQPDSTHEAAYDDMMVEWKRFGGRLNPGALRNNGHTYQEWLTWMQADQHEETCPPHHVPQTLYFLVRQDDGRLLGAISIRHRLNEDLLHTGGHVGYGIRPSERRKGYATQMLALALEKCRSMGMQKVLVTCDKDNIGSAKVIMKNGGIYEDEATEEDGTVVLRFWITLSGVATA
jgi:predicted acetyltransferase